ncbi:MAG TPA: efflux RND transporter periplasmic adaptor subunit [Candidatus Limnocylindria bacterium]|nr:efflux RND transporter periplasmic adaptor subunit [Candidatus Limnocylindria bacterium]
MKKRMVIMLAAIAVFIVVLGLVKFLQIRAAIAQGASFQPPPEAVTTIVARPEQWQATSSTIGTVTAVQGVTVSADLPGIVKNIDFTSGKRVRAGDVLVRLDTSQERAQLAAAESQRDLAKLNLERSRQLLERQVIAQAEYDRIAAEAKQAEARAGEIRATIERKRIRAPFAGVLGIRQISLGQYLNSGDPVVPLQAMDPVYVSFSLPQRDVGSLKTGAEVTVSADSIAGFNAVGKITAINSVVDAATRNVEVQATFRNPRARLRPGMFVEVQTNLGASDSVIALPASAINYAPYGNSVFVVGDLKGPDGKTYRGVQQRFVRLGGGRGDQVAVSSGIKPGEEVVTSGVFKLRNGASILVNNKTQPSNDPTPTPEDS